MAIINSDSSAKTWILYSVSTVLILACGYFVYATWTEGDPETARPFLCVECGYNTTGELAVGQPVPDICPRCEKKSFYPGFRCPDCGQPLVWNEMQGKTPPTICTNCGRENWYAR